MGLYLWQCGKRLDSQDSVAPGQLDTNSLRLALSFQKDSAERSDWISQVNSAKAGSSRQQNLIVGMYTAVGQIVVLPVEELERGHFCMEQSLG